MMGGRVKAMAAAGFFTVALAAMPGRAAAPVAQHDPVAQHIAAGGADYQRGDVAAATRELQAALAALQERLGQSLARAMPPVPAGWVAEGAEVEGLGAVGGGLSVTRAYTKADASLNASIILDSPAVQAAASLLANPTAQPNLKRVKVGGQDALLRWDPATSAGEITMVVDGRVLLQIEGDSLPDGGALTRMAEGFNLALVRKVLAA